MAARRRRYLEAALSTALLGACQAPVQQAPRPIFAAPRGGVFQDPVAVVVSTEDDLLPTISPSRGLIAYAAKSNGNLDVMVRPLHGGAPVRLTSHSTDDTDPSFSPDGHRIAWVSQEDDVKGDIWVMEADGGDKRRLTGRDTADQAPAWSADNKTVFFTARPTGSTARRIDAVEVESGKRTTVIDNGWDPQVSPDGSLLFYVKLDAAPRPRIFVRRFADGKETPLTEGGYIEAAPHVARGVAGALVLFARFVDDHTSDGVVDVDDAPSLWATVFDPAQLSGAQPAMARPLTAGEGGEIFASVVQRPPPAEPSAQQDYLVYTASGRGSLEIYALPLDGVIAQGASADAVLQAGRSAEDPALRRLALRYVVATAPSLAGSARYELARELAERGQWGDAIDALDRAAATSTASELTTIVALEKERLLMLRRLHGKLMLREDADRAYVRERLAAVQALAANAAQSSRVATRAESVTAEGLYALQERARAVASFEALGARPDAPDEDAARCLDRLGEIFAQLGDLDAVARVSETVLRRFSGERYYVRRAAERWVDTAQSAPGVPAAAALEAIIRAQKDLPQVAARAAAALAQNQESAGNDIVALSSWQRIVDTFASEREVLQQALLAVGRGAARADNRILALAAFERLLNDFPEAPLVRAEARRGITTLALASAREQEDKHDLPAARATYARLLASNNELVTAHRRYIALSAELGKLDEVLDGYRQEAQRSPRDKIARYGYGFALTFVTPPDLHAAHAEVEAALELDPRFAAAHLTIGWIREALERLEPGRNWLEAAAESYETARSFVDPADRDIGSAATLNKGNALFALAKFDDAFAAYLERDLAGVRFDSPLTELLFREAFARAALREGHLDVALDMATLALRLSRHIVGEPRKSSATALLAALSLQADSYTQAERLYGEAIALYRARRDWRRMVPMLRGLALAQQAQGRDDEALGTLGHVLDIIGHGDGPPDAPHGMFMTEIPANPDNISAAVYGFDAQQEEEIARANTARILHARGNLTAARQFAARRLQLVQDASQDHRQGPRLQVELLYALHESARLFAQSGDAVNALALWEQALPIAAAQHRWPELVTALESVQAVWLVQPVLRRGRLVELTLSAAGDAASATREADIATYRRSQRFMALEHLARALAGAPSSGRGNPFTDLVATLDQAVQHGQRAVDCARLAGDGALLAHITHVVGDKTHAAPAPEPQAAELGWRALFDRALWDRAAGEAVSARWLRAAIDAYEISPAPARAPEHAAFVAAAAARLAQDKADERLWAFLERVRLFDLQPPRQRAVREPWHRWWSDLIAKRDDAKAHAARLAGAPALVRALEGAPETLPHIRHALESDGVLVQVFAPNPSTWRWVIIDANRLTWVSSAPVRDNVLPAEVRAGLGATLPRWLYVDSGDVLTTPAQALVSGGRPLGAQTEVIEVLSATYMLASFEARNASRAGVLEIAPRDDHKALGDTLPAANATAPALEQHGARRRLLVVHLPTQVDSATLTAGQTMQVLFGSARGADRIDLDTIAAMQLDAAVAVIDGTLPVSAWRATAQSFLLAGVPTTLMGGDAAQASVVAQRLASEAGGRPSTVVTRLAAEGHLAATARLSGYRGLDADGRVLFAMNEFLRLFKIGSAAFKSARDKQDKEQWSLARSAFKQILDQIAFLQEPDSRKRLKSSSDKLAPRVLGMLPKLELDNQGNLAQVYVALKDTHNAAALQEVMLASYRANHDNKGVLETLRALGRTLALGKRHADSAARFAECADLAKQSSDTVSEAECRSSLGAERRDLFDFAGAQAAYAEAVQLFAQAGSAGVVLPRRFLGFLYESALNNYDKAQEQFELALRDALAHAAQDIVPRLMLDIARVSRQRGDYEGALGWVKKAQDGLASAPPSDRAEAALEAAKIFWYRGHYRRAQEYQRQALAWAREAGNSFLEIQARSLEGLIALNQGELTRAESIMRDALTLSRLTGRRAEEAAQLNNLGSVLRDAGRLDEAVHSFREALAIDETLSSVEGRAFDLRNLAVALDRLGQHADALTAVREALTISRSIGNRYNELQCAFAEGEILESMHDPAALGALEHAASLARDASVPEVEWRALYGLGRLQKGSDAQQARKTFEAAIGVAERLGRGRQESTPGKSRDDLYDDAMLLAVEAHDVAAAHAYAERARARAGLDVLSSATLDLPDERARVLLDSELSTREAWQYALRAADKGDAAANERAHAAETQHDATLAALRQEYPRLARMFTITPVALEALQARIPQDSVVVSYFLGSSKSVALVIDRRGVKTHELVLKRETISWQVADLRRKMAAFAPVDSELAELAASLIVPLWDSLRGTKHITVLPYGPLFHVPFAALPIEGAPLLAHASSSWALSGSHLFDDLALAPASRPTRVSAFAATEDLPFAPLEAAAVASGRAHIGAAASVDALRALSDVDALDIASHGVLSGADPLASALLLAPSGHDDGRLEMRQVFGFAHMPALVALSACDTAASENGAEYLSMGNAFLGAGARTVVASQNRVSDLATAVLMKHFFRQARLVSPAEALRRAALSTRHTYTHPAHWANFVLLGDFR